MYQCRVACTVGGLHLICFTLVFDDHQLKVKLDSLLTACYMAEFCAGLWILEWA